MKRVVSLILMLVTFGSGACCGNGAAVRGLAGPGDGERGVPSGPAPDAESMGPAIATS